MASKMLRRWMEECFVVKSLTSGHEKRRFTASKGKWLCLKTQPVGLGLGGAPLPAWTISAADCQFVHENQTGSRHSKNIKYEGCSQYVAENKGSVKQQNVVCQYIFEIKRLMFFGDMLLKIQEIF